MLRSRLNEAMKDALKTQNKRVLSTVRLILAALKDRDIAARGVGRPDGITEEEILGMLQTMIKQRRESIALYEQGGRAELVQQEAEEIAVIESFLPQQMSEADTQAAVKSLIGEMGAASLKDMGGVMAELKKRFAGQMDFARASAMVKDLLGAPKS